MSVDDRGQIVLPKELRQKFGILGGQKLAVVLLERGGVPCCLQLFKVESFSDSVKKIMDNS
ncbi:MAG: HgcAB-associated protein [Methanomassiliicoccales archaeon]